MRRLMRGIKGSDEGDKGGEGEKRFKKMREVIREEVGGGRIRNRVKSSEKI